MQGDRLERFADAKCDYGARNVLLSACASVYCFSIVLIVVVLTCASNVNRLMNDSPPSSNDNAADVQMSRMKIRDLDRDALNATNADVAMSRTGGDGVGVDGDDASRYHRHRRRLRSLNAPSADLRDYCRIVNAVGNVAMGRYACCAANQVFANYCCKRCHRRCYPIGIADDRDVCRGSLVCCRWSGRDSRSCCAREK